MDTSAARLLLIHAETPLHPGTGSALGSVDLPVARERHTQWPLIPASSLKGVLRDRCIGDKEKAWVVFGPDTDNASEYSGALALTDARALAFPVRSLRGLFAWVTCPAALQRLQRDLSIAGVSDLASALEALLPEAEKTIKTDTDKKALVASGHLTTGVAEDNTTNMVLEEFDFIAEECSPLADFGRALDTLLGQGTRLGTHMAVVSDNAYGHYVRFATEVMARIAIDSATKTVKEGALFYEEFLPAGTIFYSVAMATAPRKKNYKDIDGAAGVLDFLKSNLQKPIIQIGANATTGKGLCHVAITGGA